MFEIAAYDDEHAVLERTHSKTSSQAGTSIVSSHSTKFNHRMDSKPPLDEYQTGSGNDYTIRLHY